MFYNKADIDWVKEILEDIKINKRYLMEHFGEKIEEDKLRVEMMKIDVELISNLLNHKKER